MEVLGQHFKQFTEDYIKKSYQTKWSFAQDDNFLNVREEKQLDHMTV